MSAHSLSLPIYSLLQDKDPSPELALEVTELLKQLGIEKDITVEYVPPLPGSSGIGGFQFKGFSALAVDVLNELNKRIQAGYENGEQVQEESS